MAGFFTPPATKPHKSSTRLKTRVPKPIHERPSTKNTSPTLPYLPTPPPSESSTTATNASLDSIVCKHCKKAILKSSAADHIIGCLRSKQEKARKKKEAREAAQRAKERAERGDDEDDEDEDDEVKDGKRANGLTRKSDDTGDGPKKKKKKALLDDKAKSKAKGPVDVERQCGVALPNGAQCARSLTCKSHSMGAKRAVPGRSLPYDVLLAQYQKKNQARQQKAAIDATANALLDDDDEDGFAGVVDSDEEMGQVMGAIQRSISLRGPAVENPRINVGTRRRYQLVRMKEMLSNALSGHRAAGMFAVPNDGGIGRMPAGGLGISIPQSAVAGAMPQSARG